MNVLFGDGHVIFAGVRANSATKMAFDPNFWAVDPGGDKDAFRVIADAFKP
jgi:hypothetical protein